MTTVMHATHFCVGNPCWICHPQLNPFSSEPYSPYGTTVVTGNKIMLGHVEPVETAPSLSDADVERIARRVAKLLKKKKR